MLIKELLKKIIFPILHLIRRILLIIQNHCLPSSYLPSNQSSYNKYLSDELDKSYNHFKKYFKYSIFLNSDEIQKYAIEKSLTNDKDLEHTYIEFGVFVGTTINFFSKYLKKIYGFDSFEGLKEDWLGNDVSAGTFNLNKKIPKLNKNVVPVVGWVQDTLDNFLEEKKPKINFVHMDMDTYETSKFILKKIKPYLIKNSIIIFDELYDYPGWKEGEYKALTECFEENEYKFLAFCKNGDQAVIQII